jgi:hypothetical protein
MINLADLGSAAMLNGLASQMDGGAIEMLDSHQRVLAVLNLGSPAAMPATDGVLELNKIAEKDAAQGGVFAFARILTRSGAEVFICDIGDRDSTATIKLSTTAVAEGSPVRLDSFVLSLP